MEQNCFGAMPQRVIADGLEPSLPDREEEIVKAGLNQIEQIAVSAKRLAAEVGLLLMGEVIQKPANKKNKGRRHSCERI